VMGEGPADDEAARFDRHDDIDGGVAVVLDKPVDRLFEAPGILDKGGDIPKLDPWLGEIGNRTDEVLEVVNRGNGRGGNET
jgi:hypothetical protein